MRSFAVNPLPTPLSSPLSVPGRGQFTDPGYPTLKNNYLVRDAVASRRSLGNWKFLAGYLETTKPTAKTFGYL